MGGVINITIFAFTSQSLFLVPNLDWLDLKFYTFVSMHINDNRASMQEC